MLPADEVSLGFDNITGKRIRKVRRGFKTEKEARHAYHELMNNFGKMAFKSNSSMSYGEYFESIFLPWYHSRVKQRTYDNRLSSMKIHFKFFYKLKVSEITPIQVQKWQNSMTKKFSNSYIRNIYGLFSMSLDRANKLGMIYNNPAQLVGNVKKVKSDVDFWTKEEFEKVISTFDTSDYYEQFSFTIVWLLFMTGLRFGEAQALQWEDINFEQRTLTINKTLFYKNASNFESVEPKTRASNRVIALDADTLVFMNEWKVTQEKNGGSDFILSYNGLPTNKHTARHIIKRHAKLAGVHDIKIHALRHSHASLLISMGENHLIIKDRLGHEDIKTTLGTYGHLYPNSNFEVADNLSGIMKIEVNQELRKEKPKFVANQYLKKD